MNGKDLFKGLGRINTKYYEEAEYETITPARRAFRWPLLLAAVIAMTLLLAGCAVVYMLHMQDLKVGDRTATKPVFETNGMDLKGFEEVNEQVLTLAGLKGSDGYKAALEWFQFKQEYDPDHVIHMQAYSAGSVPEFPAEFDSYQLYTQEMKDKLDSILKTHHLKPAGAPLEFRSTQNLCTALNVEKIQASQDAVSVRVKDGTAYENGNFRLSLDFGLPDEGNEIQSTWGTLLWNRKDCFSEDTIAIEDTGDWQEWNYTTASGSQVLIMRAESDWRGWIICDRPDAAMSVMLEARVDLGYNDEDGKTWFEYLYLTDRQLEQIADAIDFGIQPRVATREDVENQAGVSGEATQDGYTIKIKSFESDGELAYLTLSITAPEGTVISHPAPGNSYETIFNIMPGNSGILTMAGPEGTVPAGIHLMPQEDHDGLDNTQDFVYMMDSIWEPGSKLFGPGSTWTLRIEDLIHSYWDGQRMVDEVLAQGEWQFDIPIQETDGDFREMELVPVPITVQGGVGTKADGSDEMGDVILTSFTLRSLSATLENDPDHRGEIARGDIRKIFVVMQDGTQVELQGVSGDGHKEIMSTASPIDVTQVDHVLLPDGTKLTARP